MIARRVLIVTQFYASEPCAAAHRVQALAQALASRGMDVRVLAPMPSFPSGKIFAGYERGVFARERDGAVEVLRVRHIASAGRGGRLLAWSSFAVIASLYVLFARKFDAIAISTPPITLGLPALLAHSFRRARILMDVRDVFPDLPVQMGVWSERGLPARAVGALARALYVRADLVSAVTTTALERIRRREPRARTTLARNAPDAVAAAAAARAENDGFLAVFAGNMGVANGLDVLLDAAGLLQARGSAVRFALVGGGAEFGRVRARVQSESLRNVELLGVLPRERAVGLLASADASIVILRAGIEESIPTKIFDACAVGCPVVLSAGGEARLLLEKAQAALCVVPGDARALADGLERLAHDEQLSQRLRTNGRNLARTVGDRSSIMADLGSLIYQVISGQTPAST